MRTSKVLGKITVLTLLFSALTACNELTPEPAQAMKDGGSTLPVGNSSAGSGGGSGGEPSGKTLGVKNYNQLNVTYEKLTDLNRARYNALFQRLQGSLPANNDIAGYTRFNLTATSQLADAYCTDYIAEKVPPEMFTSWNTEAMIQHFMENFLDPNSGSDYSVLETELADLYANQDGLFPNLSSDPVVARKDLSTAACVMVLVSPYIIFLE